MTQPAQVTDADRGPSVRLATLQRGDTAEFRIELAEYKQRKFVSLRQWNRAPDGSSRPDAKRGCSIRLRELADVIKALGMAADLASGARKAAP